MEVPDGPKLRILSLGAGVQSTTLALMAAHGEIGPMPDFALFADTQWEPKAVYEHLEWLCSPNVLPFPVHRISAGSIVDNLISRQSGRVRNTHFLSIPYFSRERIPAGTEVPVYEDRLIDGELREVQIGTRVLERDEFKNGMGRRQCTSHYKIEPMQQFVRKALGIKPRQRRYSVYAEKWIGISKDESQRMKPSGVRYERNRWPLIELGMKRSDCLTWLRRNDYPEPPKSSCLGCPFHSDAQWRDIKKNSSAEWDQVVELDKLLRSDPSPGMRAEEFMHPKRVPLSEVDLSNASDKGQIDLFSNECDGVCGV